MVAAAELKLHEVEAPVGRRVFPTGLLPASLRSFLHIVE